MVAHDSPCLAGESSENGEPVKVREKVSAAEESRGRTLDEFIAAHDRPRLAELLDLEVGELTQLHETIALIRAFAQIEEDGW